LFINYLTYSLFNLWFLLNKTFCSILSTTGNPTQRGSRLPQHLIDGIMSFVKNNVAAVCFVALM